MSQPDAIQLPARAAAVPALARRLAALQAGQPVVFEHVTVAAQPFLAAVVSATVHRRTWVVCANLQAQEFFLNEVVTWHPDTVFLPELEQAPSPEALPDPDVSADRLGALMSLQTERGKELVLVCAGSLDDAVPAPGQLQECTVRLECGQSCGHGDLLNRLTAGGYERVPQVAVRGQFAVRGGVVDVFAWHQQQPVRIEFSGEAIASLREFDLDTQTTVRPLEACTLLLGDTQGGTVPLRACIGPDDVVIDVTGAAAQPERACAARRQALFLEGAASPDAPEDYAGAFFDHGLGEFEAGDLVVHEGRRARLFGQLGEWLDAGWQVFVFCNNEGEEERLRDILPPDLTARHGLVLARGTLTHGFILPDGKLAVLCDAELFGRYRQPLARRVGRRLRAAAHRAQIDFSELAEGDLVVHLEHGIARYRGMRTLPGETGAGGGETLVLEFAGNARLYVPIEQSFLVSRYVGVGRRHPPLSTLGDSRWVRAKKNAERAALDYAARLLRVQAERETTPGFAFAPDDRWQHEFERSFLFTETPDQLRAIAETKADMESPRPMDRLICGDVGFGKTEVAIRAAFKAVMNGRQVAVLVPTTVLAQQHYRTFRERMSDYPVMIEVLSRFRSTREQRSILRRLAEGGVDIVIGTHRLISGDVQFRQLGLVIIDEEQRFGVLHKERFKELWKLVDMLTLSATPIPRTLYLSLMGAKDMSLIETPPPNRIPIETIVCPYDERILRDAIARELTRKGQVYLLHNRVRTIERLAQRVRELCPEARVDVGHGQMDEHTLEEVMWRFVSGQTDVLVSTTIIESGLDIPNANTIIIDRADRFGLADLYQLRGRVGRAQHKAYAYLLLPRDMFTVGAARRRVNAIRQYSSLGAGFKIAMRDLEIRGAGNILGTAQSGHVMAVGFDLYCQLLRQAIARLKGGAPGPRVEVSLRLDFVVTTESAWVTGGGGERCQPSAAVPSAIPSPACPAFLPAAYLPESTMRMQAYRQLAGIASQEELDALRQAWRDRFGPLPEAVVNLLLLAEIRLAAAARHITTVEVRERKLMLTRGGDYLLVGGKFPRLTAPHPADMLAEIGDLLRSL